MPKQRKVPKDKKTGVPKKYLSGAKNRSAKAYRKGEYIDIKAIQKSRVAQDGRKTKKKTSKRGRKKKS
jgi:hypothetical protein